MERNVSTLLFPPRALGAETCLQRMMADAIHAECLEIIIGRSSTRGDLQKGRERVPPTTASWHCHR